MQITNKWLEDRAAYWQEKGVVEKVTVANANGDTALQIAQIENMISQGYDAIIVVVGSETALNAVCEKAEATGIKIISFDSLPSTDKITSKMTPPQELFGSLWATWLVENMGTTGNIIVHGGPAGVALVEQRYNGAMEIINKYPGIKVVANLHSEYNEAPAMNDLRPVLDANPNITGVLALGGAQSSAALKLMQEKGMKLVPITGENYNGYLKNWYSEIANGFESIAVCQPNWMSALSLDLAIRAIQGFKVPAKIDLEPPVVTNDNIGDYVPNDFPDDYYVLPPIGEDDYDKILGPLEK